MPSVGRYVVSPQVDHPSLRGFREDEAAALYDSDKNQIPIKDGPARRARKWI